jgi:hypothetical protein
MLTPKYPTGQKVKIITLIDGFGRPDPRGKEYVGRAGEVVRSYYVSPDEVWEKILKLEDLYCYDVRLDEEGEIARGIPEIGLETIILKGLT